MMKILNVQSLLGYFFISFCFLSTAYSQPDYELSNASIKADFRSVNGKLQQQFYAMGQSGWQLVVSNASAKYTDEAPLYNTSYNKGARYLLSQLNVSSIRKEQKDGIPRLTISGKLNNLNITMFIALAKDDEYFHVEIETNVPRPGARVEYILADYVFHANSAYPEFVHTPALKFQANDIVGDRSFWSPSVIMQHGSRLVALVPDLDIINTNKVPARGARPVATGRSFAVPVDSSNITFPTGLDVNADTTASRPPLFSYGYIDAIATHHMHWVHPNNSSMIRSVKTNLKFGFDLFIGANAERLTGYRGVSKHIWNKYGTAEFNKSKSLAMPLDEYARVCYPASAAYEGSTLQNRDGKLMAAHTAPEGSKNLQSWLEWEMQGKPVGGYRNNAPQWYEMIGNTAWWNNVRDAVGMHRWGKRLGDSTLISKARRVINLAMQAPQEKGFFPVIYKYEQKKWIGNHWSPPRELDSSRSERYFDDESTSYHTSSMSKTAAHLLQYYVHCEKRADILSFVTRYADHLVEEIDNEGCIPSFFNSDLTANPHLQKNGAGGVHCWMFAVLHQVTGNQKYLRAAEKVARYVASRVLPTQDWKDYEAYFSCGVKPLNFYDRYTGQGPRNTLSMHWALEGFLTLYETTQNKHFLEKAEEVADYLSLYQTVWQPHYIITAYAFGGFGVQNTDAEWLDARQGEIAPSFVKLGVITGRKDLIERGVAASRASLILINHERHIKNNLYGYPNFPLGLGPENIDHEGRPQSPMRTNAGWGEVSALSGAADILERIGDLYIDADKQFAVGVNGIKASDLNIENGIVKLTLSNSFSDLKFPYEQQIEVKPVIKSTSATLPTLSIQRPENISVGNIEKAD